MNPKLSDSKGCGHNSYISLEGGPKKYYIKTFKDVLNFLPFPYSRVSRMQLYYGPVLRFS